jgi:hypothetical protein
MATTRRKLTPRLRIVVTGDIFYEQYVWSYGLTPRDGQHLPYTGPDDLRASRATATFRELSGAPLHASIFKNILRECGFDSNKIALQVDPVPKLTEAILQSKLAKEYPKLVDSLHSGPFPVYLHELDSFPISDTRHGTSDTVWRLARSYGELRLPESNKTKKRKQLDTSIVNNLAITPTKKLFKEVLNETTRPTVIIINDRNALKADNDDTSIRNVFEQVVDNCTNDKDPSTPKDLIPKDTTKLLILWHTRHPIHDKNFLATFLQHPEYAARTIPIVDYLCLRDHGVPLRFDTSYESSLKSLLASIHHPVISYLLQFPHVLIRFEYGVMHLTAANGALIGLDIHGVNAGPYDSPPNKHGIITGRTPLLISAILREICLYYTVHKSDCLSQFLKDSSVITHPTVLNGQPLDRGIDIGITLGDMHFRRGYGLYKPSVMPEHLRNEATDELYSDVMRELCTVAPNMIEEADSPDKARKSDYTRLAMKADEADKLGIQRLTRISVPSYMLGDNFDAMSLRKSFSRVDLLSAKDLIGSESGDELIATSSHSNTHHYTVRRIVQLGLDRVLTRSAIKGLIYEPSIVCPFVSFGDYRTIDAMDIDVLLAVRNVVAKYLIETSWTAPLGIAVFGKPGSGKSRIAREVIRSVSGCIYEKSLECNMSQWSDTRALGRQFHRIQDHTLDGFTPVILFDEFDSPLGDRTVGWLRHFLMPLQDGVFVDGGDTFRLGKAIFIFAGGVAHSYKEFCERFGSLNEDKVPDFISRLRGCIDVQDLTYDIQTAEPLSGKQSFELTAVERRAQVRRAVILRQLLKVHMGQIFDRDVANVHTAIIDAFLYTPEFTHGVRSMEAIIQMSRVSPKASSYMPSALPHSSQLALHVNPNVFLSRIQNVSDN